MRNVTAKRRVGGRTAQCVLLLTAVVAPSLLTLQHDDSARCQAPIAPIDVPNVPRGGNSGDKPTEPLHPPLPERVFAILHLGFCPDGKSLLASSDTLSLLLDSTSGAVIRSFRTNGPDGHKYYVETVALSPDGKRFATGSNGAVIVWDVATGAKTRRLAGFSEEGIDATHGLAFSPDGSRVVACAEDDRLRAIVWTTDTGKVVATLDAASYQAAYAKSATFSQDGDQVIIGMDNGAILLWRLSTRQVRALKGAHGLEVSALAPSVTGNSVLSGSRNDVVSLWDLGTGTKIRDFKGHEFSAASIAFSRDGRYVAAGRYEGATVWDCASGKEVVFIPTAPPKKDGIVAATGYVDAVAFSPNGSELAGGFGDGSIRIWNPQTGRLLRKLHPSAPRK